MIRNATRFVSFSAVQHIVIICVITYFSNNIYIYRSQLLFPAQETGACAGNHRNSHGFLHITPMILENVIRRSHQNASPRQGTNADTYCAETLVIRMVSFTFRYLDDDDAESIFEKNIKKKLARPLARQKQ